ncbi:MAG TPA: ribosome-associated translation inhibitor RaiA [Terriglobia bacterium]|jgi:putative sigma-54 modulation protein|nr:ribosome-associated translation inhibitor RaiA [Terriglobia bacterium]
MRIDFTGRQIEISTDLRKYTEERLRKLLRIFGDRFEVHVILTAEKHRRIAEITLKFRDQTFVGIEVTRDARTSINGALDKIERQAVRLLEKRRTRKRRPSPASAVLLNVLGGRRVDHEDRRLLETERIPIKPMTIEEAIEALDGRGDGAVVFRNPETERVNVIYQRPDGNLGLIEPEP